MKTNEKMLSALISRLQLPAVTAVCRGTPQAATETDGNAARTADSTAFSSARKTMSASASAAISGRRRSGRTTDVAP